MADAATKQRDANANMSDQEKKSLDQASEIEVTSEEAKAMGAFVEDALTAEEALESAEDNGPEVL